MVECFVLEVREEGHVCHNIKDTDEAKEALLLKETTVSTDMTEEA